MIIMKPGCWQSLADRQVWTELAVLPGTNLQHISPSEGSPEDKKSGFKRVELQPRTINWFLVFLRILQLSISLR